MKQNLQPWLDYFALLQTYVRQGYLEVIPAAPEAYITLPALYTLANADPNEDKLEQTQKLCNVGRHLRTYAEYLDASDEGFKLYQQNYEKIPRNNEPTSYNTILQAASNLQKLPHRPKNPFALHVVKSERPHDLLYTILLTRKRRWFWPFTSITCYEVVDYCTD